MLKYLFQIIDLVSYKAKSGTLVWRLVWSWIQHTPNLSFLKSGLLMPWSLSIRSTFKKNDPWASPVIFWAWSLGLCLLRKFTREFFWTPKVQELQSFWSFLFLKVRSVDQHQTSIAWSVRNAESHAKFQTYRIRICITRGVSEGHWH